MTYEPSVECRFKTNAHNFMWSIGQNYSFLKAVFLTHKDILKDVRSIMFGKDLEYLQCHIFSMELERNPFIILIGE